MKFELFYFGIKIIISFFSIFICNFVYMMLIIFYLEKSKICLSDENEGSNKDNIYLFFFFRGWEDKLFFIKLKLFIKCFIL